MKRVFLFAGAIFFMSNFAFMAHADRPHQGGLPPGLQKKVERGERLPPGWRKKAEVYEDGYEEPYIEEYEPEYIEEYEPEYIEDKVIRVIKDVRDLTNSFPQ